MARIGVVVILAWHLVTHPDHQTFVAAWPIAAGYVFLERWLRRTTTLGPLSVKYTLQLVSACIISVFTIAALVNFSLADDPLTHFDRALSAAFAVEIGVTAAALVTPARRQRKSGLFFLHHGLLLVALVYIVSSGVGAVALGLVLFQETTNIGSYLHWTLNSREGSLHSRYPALYNINARLTIVWYVVGRFLIVTPLLVVVVWSTWAEGPWPYRLLFGAGIPVMVVISISNTVDLIRGYLRCPSCSMNARVARSNRGHRTIRPMDGRRT